MSLHGFAKIEILSHRHLNFFDFGWQAFEQINGFAFGNEQGVLDADADAFLADVDAWLAGEDHAGLKRFELVDAVVHVEAYMVRHAVHQVFAFQGFFWVLVLHVFGGEETELDHFLFHQSVCGLVDFIDGATWAVEFGDLLHHAEHCVVAVGLSW